jgi:putative RecB family exonuclease
MGAFTNCPLAFRFAYVERLPEPPSAPASKGTLVHLALQHLLWREPADRTLDNALCDLERAAWELSDDPEFVGLDLTPEEWERFLAEARVLLSNYFRLEDPRSVRPIGLELKVEAQLDRARVRGVIDRLELDADGELVVTDYKTGNTPAERWEHKSLSGVNVYALICEQMFGRRPARVQLLYLSKPEAIIFTPQDNSTRGTAMKSNAVMDAVRRACDKDDGFRPRPSPLCEYCSFREFCPSFGGDPGRAMVELRTREAAAAGRPPLPLGV